MGDFRITIDAVGNHGCEREKQYDLAGCGQPGCTDCLTREFVEKLKASGASVQRAQIEHWPEQAFQGGYSKRESGVGPTDDLLRKSRNRKF